MATTNINRLFEIAHNEKDVENAYRYAFISQFKDFEITSPFGCDGFGVSKLDKVKVLLEFKDDLDLTNKTELAKVVAQSIYYVKKFYQQGLIPPSTVFIGDRNECLTFHVNDILQYLELDIDWNIAPSSAHKNINLISKIIEDDKIKPFVFKSDDFQQCVKKVKELTDNIQRKVIVTEQNITTVFDYFDKKVLIGTSLSTNEKVNLFIQLITNKELLKKCSIHYDKKSKTIPTKTFGDVKINSISTFDSFFAHFTSPISTEDRRKLSGIIDRIIEDTTRRKQGEFFTPTIWVNKAHEYITSVFGEDWKEKYVVWDPAWGTGNLTRDYKFKELYVSTLNQSDIDTANQMGYNPEAVKFQYDFLNDDYEKLPQGLRDAIESGKEIIVLMNPPYGTARTDKNESVSKNDIAKTFINSEMLGEKLGESAKQLYSQFLYRVTKIGIKKIGMFSPSLFLTTKSYQNFRKKILRQTSVVKGFVMNAKEFDGTSEWPILFSLFSDGITTSTFDLIDSKEDFELHVVGQKNLEYDDKERGCDWIKINSNLSKVIVPNLSSTLQTKNTNKKGVEGMICVLNNGTNRVEKNEKECAFLSSMYSGNIGVPVTCENFTKATALFTSRKSIKPNWLNMKDEYFVPDENHTEYNQFIIDSILYSIFNNRSYQSSLRQVEYKDQLWDIKNEFFWMSKDKMKDLADKIGYDELCNDARTSSDRYVYNLLFGEERIYDRLSEDAKLVLDKATELVEKSIKARKIMANNENHLDSWDAGYAQLKLVWKDYFPVEFKEFRQLYKNLEDRMRPLVYELGFLKK